MVHAEHGVGQFLGLREIEQGEPRAITCCWNTPAAAKLYVPLTRMDLVQRFRGAGEAQARARPHGRRHLDPDQDARQGQDARHGGRAAEALRRSAKWPRASRSRRDSNWQREFEDAFEYHRTKDQLTAIREIKNDMESPQPMDRLLCGDVGFGKTEVVMRAAFKALGDGKQVAVLAPTTVLASSISKRSSAASSLSRCVSRCSAGSAARRKSRQSLEDLGGGQSGYCDRHAPAAFEGCRV